MKAAGKHLFFIAFNFKSPQRVAAAFITFKYLLNTSIVLYEICSTCEVKPMTFVLRIRSTFVNLRV